MRLLAGFGLLANAVTLFLFDPPTPQTNTLQMEKNFVLMTMLSFLIKTRPWSERIFLRRMGFSPNFVDLKKDISVILNY